MRRRLFWLTVLIILWGWQAQDHDAVAQSGTQLVLYQAPVSDPVIDAFRPPGHVGAAGNRGLEYGNPPRRLVVAAADGVVSFAGSVFGTGVVTIQHADGIRTTYVGLGDMFVSEGETVNQADHVAVAVVNLHFGALIHDHYLDPQILIDASQPGERPRLIPAPDND